MPGARHVRRHPRWPEPGSFLDHTSDLGPVRVRDGTVVRTAEPPRLPVLEARPQPLGVLEVAVRLAPTSAGCALRIEEMAACGLLARGRLAPVVSATLALRNVELVRRLGRLVALRRERAEASGHRA